MEKEPRMSEFWGEKFFFLENIFQIPEIYYGSVEEFTENFKIFHHFTGSHKYFGTDDEPYQVIFWIFKKKFFLIFNSRTLQ